MNLLNYRSSVDVSWEDLYQVCYTLGAIASVLAPVSRNILST